jgi:phosphohistidine swiveling domain-containing protein
VDLEVRLLGLRQVIVFLDQAADTPLSQIGGKAKALAWAMRQCWPVPPGFVLSVDGTGDVPAALAKLGAERVAVRSSATEEDGEHHSFAGQFDTVLNVKPDEVEAAIAKVRSSATSPRVQAYRNSKESVPIAVIVQAMIPATHAGVMFTTDPDDVTESHLVIEASAGLGERVVSGSVTPDRYTLKKNEPVQSQTGCLSDNQLSQLLALATKVEAACGAPQDVEFSFENDHQLWLLQHRPITTITAKEREAIRKEIIVHLKSRVHLGPLVRENLAESLDAPTPMTWAVVRPMFTGTGAIGRMNKGFGGTPDESLGDEAAYELVAGRVMHRPVVDLRLIHRDAASLKGYGGGFFAKLRALWSLLKYTNGVVKTFRKYTFRKYEVKPLLDALPYLATRSPQQLVQEFNRLRKVIDETAFMAFQPAVLAQHARRQLPQTVDDLSLMQDLPITEECNLTNGFAALSTGAMDEDTFLLQFGHRSHNELELAQPRYSETGVPQVTPTKRNKPTAMTHTPAIDKVRRFLALREEAKHHLVAGFFAIRKVLLELDRRFNLHNGIFYLLPSELPQLLAGDNLLSLIRTRQRRRRAELSLELPHSLDQDFEAIGRPAPPLNGSCLQGTGVSVGVAEGVVLKLTEPQSHVFSGPTILVCPSTDPGWLPLLMQCAGAVMESGGTLSHGAIVCRELGVPAVAGVPGLMEQLMTGDRIRIDGRLGTIEVPTEPTS